MVAQLPDESRSRAGGTLRVERIQVDALSSCTATGTQWQCSVVRSVIIVASITNTVISSSAIVNSKEMLNG